MFVASIALASVAACGSSPDGPTTPTPRGDGPPGPPPPLSGQSAVVVAVADIGECGSAGVEQSARLADRIDGQVILAGDLAYYQGTMADFLRCFDPIWGRFRPRWRPAPGNHEYETPGAAGYFQYFGEAAGQGFYAFRTGDWQVLMLNSNVQAGVGRGSAQFEFVRAELARHRTPCTMAVWHHPLFSSGPNGSSLFMQDLWRLLYEQDADVIVAGHDHLYERFAKQDAEGRSDVRGLRQFIVGTGGAQLYDFMRVTPNSQARIKAHGVLRLTLHPSSYEWAFIDATGGVADSGSDGCH
jgi:acid phosphatase type 7